MIFCWALRVSEAVVMGKGESSQAELQMRDVLLADNTGHLHVERSKADQAGK